MESMFLEIAVTEREMDRRLLEVAINGNTMELHQLLQEDPRILDREMSKCEKKEGKDNPLHIAALYGHVDFIREMLRLKWDFTRRLNSQGQSPLHLATVREQVEVVKEILKADPGACFVRDRDGMIPLHLAAIHGRLDVLKNLVEANPTTAFVLTKRGEPILHLCAKNNQTKALKKLVKMVDNPDDFVKLKDNDDNTILHVIIQAKNESWQALRYLLKKDVLDVNAKNKNGYTPAEVLVGSGTVFGIRGFIIMTLLCRAGAKHEATKILFHALWLLFCPTDAQWSIEVLLVVAALTITVAFQAGINPPGGFWQSTGDDHNGTAAMHYAGQSVMSSVDPKGYKDFSNLTDDTVTYSVLAIIMVICSWHSNTIPRIIKLSAVFCTTLSICTMWDASHVAFSFLSPDEDNTNPKARWEIYGDVFFPLVYIFIVSLFSEFFREHRFRIGLDPQKLTTLDKSQELLEVRGAFKSPSPI